MQRVARSRRQLAGLLRRRPILDSVVAVPSGTDDMPRGQDHVPSILERMDAEAPAAEEESDPSSSARQQPHMTS